MLHEWQLGPDDMIVLLVHREHETQQETIRFEDFVYAVRKEIKEQLAKEEDSRE